MKDGFALRMQLGDPGPNGTYLDLQPTLQDMLSLRFANTLRLAALPVWQRAIYA